MANVGILYYDLRKKINLLLLSMEKEMATHPSTLAWKSPWTEKPGRLQSMGSQRLGYDWATSLSLSLRVFPDGSEVKNAGDTGLIPGLGRSPGEGNGNPLQYSCLENPVDRGTWWATVYRVSKSQTWLSEQKSTIEYVVHYGFFINDLYNVEFHSMADKLLNDI